MIEELKRGGQGVVLLALQQSTGRRVAIKTLRRGLDSAADEIARFEREIDLLSRIRHPNIVTIHDRGRTADGAFFVMDLVTGGPLDEHIDSLDAAPRDVARIFERVSDAVAAAHLLGVIHRDLKPSNIRFDERGEPKVLDFGLARLMHEPRGSGREITQTGQFIGSLPWASPEQVQAGADAVDVRSDIYSIGVMLFHALTGQFPYPVTGSVPAVIQHIIDTAPTKPRQLRRTLDDEIQTIVLKCLAKEPDRRYQSAGELARDLGRYVRGEAIEAKRESTLYVIKKLAWRHRVTTVLSAVLLAAVLVGSVVSWLLYASAVKARTLADDRYAEMKIKEAQTQRALEFVGGVFNGVNPYVAAGADTTLLKRMLADARRDADSRLREDPAVEAAVRAMLGVNFATIGQRADARAELAESLRLRRERFGNRSRVVVETLLHLATLSYEELDLDSAAANCAEVEAILELQPDAWPELTANRLHIESNIANARSDFPLALRLAQEALQIREGTLAPDHPRTIISRADVAEVLKQSGRLNEAQAESERVLAAQVARYGENHPYLVAPLESLGEILMERQQYAESKAHLDRALAICRSSLPPDHPQTASILNTISTLSTTIGKYEDGLVYATEALSIRRQLAGVDSPQTAASVLNVGTALKNLGRLDEAEPYYRDAIRLTENGAGPQRIRATALNNLAALFKQRRNYSESARLDREALALRRSLFSGNHPDVAQSLNNLAVSENMLGNKATAESLFRECLAVQIAINGESSRTAAMTAVNLADLVLYRDPKNEDMIQLLRRSVEILDAGPANNERWILRGRYIIACSLYVLERYSEAETELLKCLPLARPGEKSAIHREQVLRKLAECCEKLGKLDDAAKWTAEFKAKP